MRTEALPSLLQYCCFALGLSQVPVGAFATYRVILMLRTTSERKSWKVADRVGKMRRLHNRTFGLPILRFSTDSADGVAHSMMPSDNHKVGIRTVLLTSLDGLWFKKTESPVCRCFQSNAASRMKQSVLPTSWKDCALTAAFLERHPKITLQRRVREL